jgi:hypothetical protein
MSSYHQEMRVVMIVYIAGVIVGLWRTDGSLVSRIVLALFWPLGPLAFVVTVGGLLVAALAAIAGRALSPGAS